MSIDNISLSVIVALYNNAEYIKQTLESLERQSISDFEVIIVDDGSSDHPLKIIQPFLSKNKKWRYYSHDNRGVGFTRNRAILLARGEYIGFLDSDDYVADHYFGDLLRIAKNCDACMVLSNFSKFNEDTGIEITDRKDAYNIIGSLSHRERISYIYGGRMFGLACASIFRKKLLLVEGALFPTNTYHEDIFVMPRAYSAAKKIAHCESKGYFWRMRKESESHSISSRHVINVLHALREQQEYLKDNNLYGEVKEEFTRHCVMYLNGLLRRIRGANLSAELQNYLLDLLLSASKAVFSDKADFVERNARHYGDFIHFFSAGLAPKDIINSFRQHPVKMGHCDILFFPHKKYHTVTMLPMARELQRRGFSCAFVDMSKAYAEEQAYQDFDRSEFFVVDFSDVKDGNFCYSSSVFMNDWDLKCALPTITRDNALGRGTFGVVEGIQDFWDCDTGRHRNAYQNVRYLIAAGQHDLRHFSPRLHRDCYIGGVPRIAPLLNRPVTYPSEPIALINSNFTYGVLESKRADFLSIACRVAREAGFRPVITRHPQEAGDFTGFDVSTQDMYAALAGASVLISRFSSAIIEAISLGKPAIYFNPGIERVMKFMESDGAFDICLDELSLRSALESLAERLSRTPGDVMGAGVRNSAAAFLRLHCAVGVPGANPEGIASFIGANTTILYQKSGATCKPIPANDANFEALRAKLPSVPLHYDFLRELAAILLLESEAGREKLDNSTVAFRVCEALATLPTDDPMAVHFRQVQDFVRSQV